MSVLPVLAVAAVVAPWVGGSWHGALIAVVCLLAVALTARSRRLTAAVGLLVALSVVGAAAIRRARPPAPTSTAERLERARHLDAVYSDPGYQAAVRAAAALSDAGTE